MKSHPITKSDEQMITEAKQQADEATAREMDAVTREYMNRRLAPFGRMRIAKPASMDVHDILDRTICKPEACEKAAEIMLRNGILD